MGNKIKITQVRSIIDSQLVKHKKVMVSLGFKRNQRTIYKNDTPQIRGMMDKVRHLIVWENVDEKDIPGPVERTGGFTVLKAVPAKRAGKGEAKAPESGGEQAQDKQEK